MVQNRQKVKVNFLAVLSFMGRIILEKIDFEKKG